MHPLLQRVDNIHLLEGVLYSHRLGTAGRVDCVAEWEGELSIIDFKTSRTEKRKDWITDYFLQETAYALMFGEMYNLKIKKIVTLMAVDHDETRTEGQVFVEYPKDYVEPLLKRLAKYKLMMK